MRTRLTDVLEIEHPVMLAGMGGVSYADSSPRCPRRAASAASVRRRCATEQTVARDRGRAEADREALRRRPAHRGARRHGERRSRDVIEGGASVFVAGLGVPRRRRGPVPRGQRPRRDMCGKVRTTAARASTPAATSSSPRAPRPAVTPGRSPPCRSCPRWSTPSVTRPGGRRGRHRRRPRSRRRARARRRRHLGRHAVYRHPRGARRPRLQDASSACGEDGTVVTRAYTGKTCRVVRTPTPTTSSSAPRRRAEALPRCRTSVRSRTAPTTSAATRPPRSTPPRVHARRPGRRRHRRAGARGRAGPAIRPRGRGRPRSRRRPPLRQGHRTLTPGPIGHGRRGSDVDVRRYRQRETTTCAVGGSDEISVKATERRSGVAARTRDSGRPSPPGNPNGGLTCNVRTVPSRAVI